MPEPTLILPGFFGKLPTAGDFVTRRLPADFVRFWDRWVSRHLHARLVEPDDLCFLLPGAGGLPGPMAGVVLPSADRAGRRFPLTLAAPAPGATGELPARADGWFERLAASGRRATRGELDASALEACLQALPLSCTSEGPAAARLVLWSATRIPLEVADPDAPSAALDTLLGVRREAS